ncbi:hypothetical protein AB0I06_08615 [Streptomyces sp. NPDC050674]|uniref:hypothetical protein n=1 Tax=Streptomyces sp. NPDC050674 TaxID=3157216 RepID=UPI00342158EB
MGKHHRIHGLHFLALTDENGRLIWRLADRPGRTRDITAARHDHVLAHLRTAGLGALADLGLRGRMVPAPLASFAVDHPVSSCDFRTAPAIAGGHSTEGWTR